MRVRPRRSLITTHLRRRPLTFAADHSPHAPPRRVTSLVANPPPPAPPPESSPRPVLLALRHQNALSLHEENQIFNQPECAARLAALLSPAGILRTDAFDR